MDTVAIPQRHLLLVDDHEDCALLAQLGFARAGRPVELVHVTDGRQCLQFLRREGPYGNASEPDLILLDLDMPGMDGRRAIREIRADGDLRHLPVIVLTSHDGPDEVMNLYQAGCNAYVRKPLGLAAWAAMAGCIYEFWLATALVPSRRSFGPR